MGRHTRATPDAVHRGRVRDGGERVRGTRYPCCIAFGTSGFEHVARYVRHAFHPKPLIIVADGDDAGINAANGAARAVDALVFVCDDGLDFNDMMRRAK